jgi:two-component system response regulator RegX3
VAPLHVVLVGLDRSLAGAVSRLLRDDAADVVDGADVADPGVGAGVDVVLVAGDRAHEWLPTTEAGPRVVVFEPGASGDAIVELLGRGADDVVTDGDRPQEIAARVRSVARRGGPPARRGDARTPPEGSGVLALDVDAQEVWVRGEAHLLPRRQFQLLELLVRNRGRVLTRELLIERVWEVDHPHRLLNALQVQVKRLREVVEEDPAHPTLIRTVRGVGYRYDEPPAG